MSVFKKENAKMYVYFYNINKIDTTIVYFDVETTTIHDEFLNRFSDFKAHVDKFLE